MKTLLVLLVCVGVSLLVTGRSVERQQHIMPEVGILPILPDEAQLFWTGISQADKIWMMNSSIIIQLQNSNSVNVTILPKSADLNMPPSLAPKFMNGKVPNEFQTNLVTWMKDYLGGVSDEEMIVLIQGKELCGTNVCSSIPGMGGSCCPFG